MGLGSFGHLNNVGVWSVGTSLGERAAANGKGAHAYATPISDPEGPIPLT